MKNHISLAMTMAAFTLATGARDERYCFGAYRILPVLNKLKLMCA